ncbi:MAG: YlmH/Sll1252 family protein [Oscillospiraceae bacterium]|nr:YlmH/Sll1252 family protein [Oscillospiraceae bacterium]
MSLKTAVYSSKDADKPLLRRLKDLCKGAVGGTPRFTAFLDEREQVIAQAFLDTARDINFLLYGGFDGAARRMAGIFPGYIEPSTGKFPITALAARHGKDELLEHRSVLGTLIALGVARESVGDILPEEGVCRFVAAAPVARVLVDELRRVGRVGVRCEPEALDALASNQEFSDIRGTVSSPRLDSLIRVLTNQSRERAAGLIRAGLVRRNHLVCDKPDTGFAPGDIISVRGHGKYIVDTIGELTRKGRFPVLCRKFK